MSKQQRKAAKKRKRSERDRLNGSKRAKRQAILDKPPTTLRLVDKLLLHEVELLSYTHGEKTNVIEVAKSAQEALKFGCPVFLIDDIERWAIPDPSGSSEAFPYKDIQDMGDFVLPEPMAWFEYTHSLRTNNPVTSLGCLATQLSHSQCDFMIQGWGETDAGQALNVPDDYHAAIYIRSYSSHSRIATAVHLAHGSMFFIGEDAQYIDSLHFDWWRRPRTPDEEESQRLIRIGARSCGYITMAAISFLNAHNIDPIVKQVEHTKAEKKYAEVARKPLPQYEQRVIDLWPGEQRTVHVGGEGGEGGGGGKHRWHSVRGHFARSKLGKKFWRRGHSRGDKRIGVVQKRTRIRLEQEES